MTDYDAVMIAEGVLDPLGNTDGEKLAAYHAAWQHLIDTGLCWKLQGWFGRRAEFFLAAGICSQPGEEAVDGERAVEEEDPKEG